MNAALEDSDRDAALAFLLGRIDYERAWTLPYQSRGFKLDRMRCLLAGLGNPQVGLPVVHIAGTKGKGSTAAMIASVLTAADYTTGLYTSPHLYRLEERLMVNGDACTAAELVDLVRTVQPVVEEIDHQNASAPGQTGPTYFEITTAMALVHFARRGVEIAVLEVGLGGRLDSTNICEPLVCIITSISFDHTAQLGNTLESIAAEKAGIIKPHVPVINGADQEAPRRVIEQIAQQRDCPLATLGVDFGYRYEPPGALDSDGAERRYGKMSFWHEQGEDAVELTDLRVGLLGRHQASNAAVALAALDAIRPVAWRLTEDAVREGLAAARCPARIEIIGHRPTVVIDAAHNVASIDALLQVMSESFVSSRRLLVFATSRDKDAAEMLRRLLPCFEHVIFTRYRNNPRGVPPEDLADLCGKLAAEWEADSRAALPGWTVCVDPAAAQAAVLRMATPEHLVCVTGSFFIAAEMRALLNG